MSTLQHAKTVTALLNNMVFTQGFWGSEYYRVLQKGPQGPAGGAGSLRFHGRVQSARHIGPCFSGRPV